MTPRRWEVDALRGLLLVLMTMTHLPTRLSYPLDHTFGFVSAAEGFVLLSGFTTGLVYTQRARRKGVAAMRRALWRRALLIYSCQAGLLLFLFTVIAALGVRIGQPDVKNLMSFYLSDPWTALCGGLTLIYEPALLDILPMYVLFMLASPWVLVHGLRRGWIGIMAVSAGLWLLAQFGASARIYATLVPHTGLAVPYSETGSFVTLAWQVLWTAGLRMGAGSAEGSEERRFPPWLVRTSVAIALACFFWRHAVGQDPFGPNASLNVLFEKWRLGPLRIVDLLAVLVVVLHFGPRWRHSMPRLTFLEALGSAALPVFCAHLVIVLLVLSVFGGNPQLRPAWTDVALLSASFAALYLVARLARAPSRPPAHDSVHEARHRGYPRGRLPG